MYNRDESLRKEAFRQAFAQVSGLKLSEELAEILLNGKKFPFEQLSDHYTPSEIDNALIRLDSHNESCEEETGWCITLFNGKKICFSCDLLPLRRNEES